jgi:hypothetical protein
VCVVVARKVIKLNSQLLKKTFYEINLVMKKIVYVSGLSTV